MGYGYITNFNPVRFLDKPANTTANSDAAFTKTMQDIASRADPFAPQRAQYSTQLSELMNNPAAALEQNPFFKASAEQGQEAAMRRLRGMGMADSGNAALELQKASQANMAQQFFPMAQLLGGFAGANQNPAAGAGAMTDLLGLRENQRQFDLGGQRRTVTYGGIEGSQTRLPYSWNTGSFWGGA